LEALLGQNPSQFAAPASIAAAAASAVFFQFIKMPQILIYYCHFGCGCLPKFGLGPAFIHLAT